MSFDAALPSLFSSDFRTALEQQNVPGLGSAAYSAPGGSALPFILESVNFSGGASVDKTEYPFFGGWSAEALNEKPQSIKVQGYVNGRDAMVRRNEILEAVRAATSDDAPGYISLPSWGRFPVVVEDWDVAERMDAQGKFPLTLTFTRSGLSAAARQASSTIIAKPLSSSRAVLRGTAESWFTSRLPAETLSTATLASSFGVLNTKLLSVIGRIQAAQTTLNNLTNSVLAVTNLISQGVTAPGKLVSAFFSAVDAIVAASIGVENELSSVFDDASQIFEGQERNPKNTSLAFLANRSFVLAVESVTARDEFTRLEVQNLYRLASFYAASGIITEIPDVSYDKFKAIFALLQELEEAIDRSDPELYAACADVRISVAEQLRSMELLHEKTIELPVAIPALAAAALLGVPYELFSDLNPAVEDEFVLQGPVSYV